MVVPAYAAKREKADRMMVGGNNEYREWRAQLIHGRP
jgi:hypothetical protein